MDRNNSESESSQDASSSQDSQNGSSSQDSKNSNSNSSNEPEGDSSTSGDTSNQSSPGSSQNSQNGSEGNDHTSGRKNSSASSGSKSGHKNRGDAGRGGVTRSPGRFGAAAQALKGRGKSAINAVRGVAGSAKGALGSGVAAGALGGAIATAAVAKLAHGFVSHPICMAACNHVACKVDRVRSLCMAKCPESTTKACRAAGG